MHINTNALIFHVSRFFQEVPDKEKNATKIGFPDFDELDDFFFIFQDLAKIKSFQNTVKYPKVQIVL